MLGNHFIQFMILNLLANSKGDISHNHSVKIVKFHFTNKCTFY